ncbi:MAG: septum formation inhibitor Maf [Gemmatimonadetes bacterium]|nr:MAG: septum formation inhibitor Maf [Gemmatimonadota bacterium]
MIHQPHPQIILASASPRRQFLLKQIKWEFTVDPSEVDETHNVPEQPDQNVMELARRKALHVAKRHAEGVVIGADTIVYHEGDILNKPEDRNHAMELLRRLSGNYHHVYTGVALVDAKTGRQTTGYEKTAVKFRELTPAEIEAYVDTGEPMDKAGAYGIQEYGALLVERIEGDYFNVVGLPLVRLMHLMHEFLAR